MSESLDKLIGTLIVVNIIGNKRKDVFRRYRGFCNVGKQEYIVISPYLYRDVLESSGQDYKS